MKRMPQFRLRTMFATFVCVCVALTVGTSPKVESDLSFGFYEPQLNWYHAFAAATSMAMIIGLVGQARRLTSATLRESDEKQSRFASKFAVAWRLIIVFILAACTTTTLFTARRVFTLPEQSELLDIFPAIVWKLCVIVVLAASVSRWKVRSQKPAGPWRIVAAWICGSLLAFLVLPDSAMITFLVHIATSGIEAAIPHSVSRHGVFPDHGAEGFRAFWISLAAVATVVAAATFLVLANSKCCGTRGRKTIAATGFAVLLMVAAAYCVWYYGYESHRISPDLASAGPAANWFGWLSGGLLAAVIVTAGALRLSQDCETDVVSGDASVAFHEYFVCLLLPVAAILIERIEMLRLAMSLSGLRSLFFGGTQLPPFLDLILAYLRDVTAYLALAVTVLAIHLMWLRWRRRKESVPVRISAVDGRRFLWNWLALATIVIVGVPTISAFSFVFWLGPWWMVGP
jgi:hypothetical protein